LDGCLSIAISCDIHRRQTRSTTSNSSGSSGGGGGGKCGLGVDELWFGGVDGGGDLGGGEEVLTGHSGLDPLDEGLEEGGGRRRREEGGGGGGGGGGDD